MQIYNYSNPTTIQEVKHLMELQIKKIYPKSSLKIDNDVTKLIDLTYKYFSGNKDFEKEYLQLKNGKIYYSLKKGLLLIGSTGRGKSLMMEKVYKFILKKKYEDSKTSELTGVTTRELYKYRSVSAEFIEDYFIKNQLKGFADFKRDYDDELYIDELGAENQQLNDYGLKYSPTVKILNFRYRLFVNQGIKTHASSNLDLKAFHKFYDFRLFSRLFEMFNVIIVNGIDYRIGFKIDDF